MLGNKNITLLLRLFFPFGHVTTDLFLQYVILVINPAGFLKINSNSH